MTQAPTPGPLSGDFNVEEYVADYEFRADEGSYSPTENERALLIDAIHGAFSEASLSLTPTAPVEASGSERETVTLAECPPGLFLWNGTLGFKSEYGAMEPADLGKTWTVGNRVDAYCADSGEYFWGGTSNHDDRAKVMVTPIDAYSVVPKDGINWKAEWEAVCSARIADAVLRPQPSGETRSDIIAAMREHIELGEIGACSAEIVGHDEAVDAILALLSACPAPVASGGQHSSGEADAGREAIRKVIHELWQLLDDGETGADGTVTIDQARYQEVSKAMDELEALVPDSAGPFWGGFPVNYFWGLK